MKRTTPLIVALALSCAAAWLPAAAFAQDSSEKTEEKKDGEGADAKAAKKKEDKAQAEQDEKKSDANRLASGQPITADGKNWTITALYRLTVGQGTFVGPKNEGEFSDDLADPSNTFDRVSSTFVLAPSYTLGDYIVSGQLAWSQWHTDGGSIFSNEPRQGRLSDLSFDVYWLGKTSKKTGTNFNVDFAIGLPTSKASRATSQIIDTTLSIGVRQPIFSRVIMNVSSIGGKTFHRYTSPVIDPDEVGANNALYRPGGAEDLEGNIVAMAGRNTEFYWLNGISATAVVRPDLFISMSYRFDTFWSYATDSTSEQDSFTSEYARTGRGISQLTRGNISATYRFAHWLFFNGGIATTQTPKTADNRSFRFPWWNFEGAGSNASSVFLGVRAIY